MVHTLLAVSFAPPAELHLPSQTEVSKVVVKEKKEKERGFEEAQTISHKMRVDRRRVLNIWQARAGVKHQVFKGVVLSGRSNSEGGR